MTAGRAVGAYPATLCGPAGNSSAVGETNSGSTNSVPGMTITLISKITFRRNDTCEVRPFQSGTITLI